MGSRDVLRQITPPVVADAWRRRRRHAPVWEYLGERWVDDAGAGWNSQGVVDAYTRKLPEFRRAITAPASVGVPTEAIAGVDAVPYHQNIALAMAYAVAAAAAGRSATAVLDWGGGFGFSYFLLRELHPDLTLDFHVRDVPAVVEAAGELVPEVTFWADDTCLDRTYDIALASNSLQYVPDWKGGLARLGAAAPFVMLSRTPVTEARSFVVRQQAYGTAYNGWIIGRRELVHTAADHGLELVREFLEGWTVEIAGAPALHEHRGFLFRRMR